MGFGRKTSPPPPFFYSVCLLTQIYRSVLVLDSAGPLKKKATENAMCIPTSFVNNKFFFPL